MTPRDPNKNHGLHVIVCGRVQGVGFRKFTQTCALALNLSGWAKNRTDGSVEVFAWGPSGVLQRFLQELSQGPRNAHVEDVSWKYIPWEEHTQFQIF